VVADHPPTDPKEKDMTELQSPPRRSHTAKAILGLLLAIAMVGVFATAGAAEDTGSPRSGQLHVTKECHEFTGLPGGFCTITGSNLNAIDPGMKVVYTDPAVVGNVLSSDLFVDGPGDNDAYGHVDLTLGTFTGPLTLSGGTGRFRGFHATITVTCDTPAGSPCAWDGPYSFTPPGHDQ
jgi:hypothetical protein